MATPDQISFVRFNTDEPSAGSLTDEEIGGLIDSLGDEREAVVAIWERKAASYSSLVDVSEAGASRKMSDLYKAALAMADRWRKKIDGPVVPPVDTGGRAKIHRIERL